MQYEQILNGRMIEELGYGRMTFRLSRGVLEDWLKNLPDYHQKISELHFDNNILFDKLDAVINDLRQRNNGN